MAQRSAYHLQPRAVHCERPVIVPGSQFHKKRTMESSVYGSNNICSIIQSISDKMGYRMLRNTTGCPYFTRCWKLVSRSNMSLKIVFLDSAKTTTTSPPLITTLPRRSLPLLTTLPSTINSTVKNTGKCPLTIQM